MIDFTNKQKEVWRNTIRGQHRWNISYGATRSGKTYLDYYKIPYRIRNASDDGLIAIIGNTQATLERNILEPLRKIWTPSLVGKISSKNEIVLFGKKVYALGADKVSQVSKIQGAGFSYVYGDEVTTWSKGVFDMLKSRLDKPTSTFDGTCNPEAPTHWFKKDFLDKTDLDIYQMGFCIDDNKFLDPNFVRELKKEYYGTVLYDRYIKGNWVAAEGVVFKSFADDPDAYIVDKVPEEYKMVTIGIDFGGNKSGHAFIATAFSPDFRQIIAVEEYYRQEEISPTQLEDDFIDFVRLVSSQYQILEIRADSAESTLIMGLNSALMKNRLPYEVDKAIKGRITERIRLYNILINRGSYKILSKCKVLIESMRTAVYDSKSLEDKRLDDGTTNIDTLDAQEYSTEPFYDVLIYGG